MPLLLLLRENAVTISTYEHKQRVQTRPLTSDNIRAFPATIKT